jgi:hypothetical protein
MSYRGWHGVQDHLHILVAVSYEPVDASLACKFNTGEPLIHVGVPERKYQILLTSPYAGTYYRTHIRSKYPCPFAQNPPPYKPSEDGPARKSAAQARERMGAVTASKPMTLDLFGQPVCGIGSQARKHVKVS